MSAPFSDNATILFDAYSKDISQQTLHFWECCWGTKIYHNCWLVLVYMKITSKSYNENDRKCSERRVKRIYLSLVCFLHYERALLFRLLSLNNSQHSLIYFIRYEKTSSLMGYRTIIHSAPTMDPPRFLYQVLQDLHCIISGVAFLSLLCKAVQHSSPGNYMSIAWGKQKQEFRDVNKHYMGAAKDKHLPGCPFRSSFSLFSPKAQFF